MRSLWSQAGQAHHCGCRACSTALNGLGRRATATVRRRKPTFAEIFTACYSSVFATATIVDSIRKTDQRQQLDRELEAARRELAELESQCPPTSRPSSKPQARPENLTIDQMDVLWRSLKWICNNRPDMYLLHHPVSLDTSELVSKLRRERYRCPDESSLLSLRKTDRRRIELALIAEETDPTLERRTPHTDDHLSSLKRNHIQSIKRLVSSAFHLRYHELAAKIKGSSQTIQDAGREDPAKSLAEVKDLLRQGYPYYMLTPQTLNRTRIEITELNKSIRQLAEVPRMRWSDKVAAMCYNVLVSEHHPDTHTYNALLLALGNSDDFRLATPVVHSFIHGSLLMPTPSTWGLILHHWKNAGRPSMFVRTLERITGLDTVQGAKVRRKHVADVESNGLLKQWASDSKLRTRTGDYYHEHAPLNIITIEAIIGGLLHFKMFSQAAHFFISCIYTGVSLSAKIVRQVLDECIFDLDLSAAKQLLQGFVLCSGKWQQYVESADEEATAYLIDRIYVLLDICGHRIPAHAPSKVLLANLQVSKGSLSRFLEDLGSLDMFHPESSCVRGLAVHLMPEPGAQSDSVLYHRSTGKTSDAKAFAIRNIGSGSRFLQLASIGKELSIARRSALAMQQELVRCTRSRDANLRARITLYVGDTALRTSANYSKEFAEILASHANPSPTLQTTLEICNATEGALEPAVEGFIQVPVPSLVGDEQGDWLDESPEQIYGVGDTEGAIQASTATSVEQSGDDAQRHSLRGSVNGIGQRFRKWPGIEAWGSPPRTRELGESREMKSLQT